MGWGVRRFHNNIDMFSNPTELGKSSIPHCSGNRHYSVHYHTGYSSGIPISRPPRDKPTSTVLIYYGLNPLLRPFRQDQKRSPIGENVVLHYMCVLFNHGRHGTNHCVWARLGGKVKLTLTINMAVVALVEETKSRISPTRLLLPIEWALFSGL